MALRIVHKVNDSVKVYRDTEWQEFVVKANGEKRYHTDDKQDAIDTANIIAADEVQNHD